MKTTIKITYHLVSSEHKYHVEVDTDLTSLDADEVYDECIALLDMVANIEHISVHVHDTNMIMEYKYNEG